MEKIKNLLIANLVLMLVLVGAQTRLGMAAPTTAPAAANVPLTGAFAYTGRLGVANGTYDLQFKLYDAATAGALVTPAIVKENVAVRTQSYLVELAFAPKAFQGSARWLEAGWRPGTSTGAFTPLAPRELMTGTPYALYARSIPLAGTGSSVRAARSDHNHSGQTWAGTSGLSVVNEGTGGAALFGVDGSAGGVGVYGSSISGAGVYARSQGTGLAASSLQAENTGGGIALWAQTTSSNDSAVVIANDAASGSGADLLRGFNQGNLTLRVTKDGDVSQAPAADGLVKAGVSAFCGGAGTSIYNQFNNVTTAPITISSDAIGSCTVTFPFNVAQRYVVVTGKGPGNVATYLADSRTSLAIDTWQIWHCRSVEDFCAERDVVPENASIMILVY